MDRAIPEGNPLTYKRRVDHTHKLHRERMRFMKKGIDNNLPSACIYPINNAKKEQLIEGKSSCDFLITAS